MRTSLALGLVFSLAACGGDPPPTPPGDDGGRDAAIDAQTAGGCASDDDCADSTFCDGVEICDPENELADDRGCVEGAMPCAIATSCDEVNDRCAAACTTDADADGQRPPECGGADCDDADPSRYTGSSEVCDATGHDEDCDPSTYGFRDADGDGAPDAACCNTRPDAEPICGDDCDDMRPGVNPDNPDICNGRDDDCDGSTDEEVQVVLVEDVDRDGYGSADPAAATMLGCGPIPGWRVGADDCDDAEESRHPGATEQCDGADDDCDGTIDERMGGCGCSLGAMQACSTDVGVCTAGTQMCATGGVWGPCSGTEPTGETCNGADDDCDGATDEGAGITCHPDGDGDGYASAGATSFTACRDPNPARAVAPFLGCPMGSTGTAPSTAPPTPTADCDDASASTRTGSLCYRDADGDRYGASGSAPVSTTCGACPSGESSVRGDCCDTDATTSPLGDFASTRDACASWDRNCDGFVTQETGLGGGTCVRDPDTLDCTFEGSGGYTSEPVPDCGGAAGAMLGCNGTCRPILRSTVQRCM